MTTGNALTIDQQANENKLENIKENPQSWTAWKREATRLWYFIRNASIIEIACENPSIKDYMEHWGDRALKAEKKLAAFEKPVPVEPEIVKQDRIDNVAGTFRDTRLKYIDALQSALQRAQEKAVDDCKLWRDRRDEALTALEKAESINRRMVELLKEPSAPMKNMARGLLNLSTVKTEADATMLFKAMSAELLKEVEK